MSPTYPCRHPKFPVAHIAAWLFPHYPQDLRQCGPQTRRAADTQRFVPFASHPECLVLTVISSQTGGEPRTRESSLWGPSTHRHRVCVSVSSLEWGNPPLLHPTKQTLGQEVQPAMPSTQICMDCRQQTRKCTQRGGVGEHARKGCGLSTTRPLPTPPPEDGRRPRWRHGFPLGPAGVPCHGKDRDGGAKLRGWRYRTGRWEDDINPGASAAQGGRRAAGLGR